MDEPWLRRRDLCGLFLWKNLQCMDDDNVAQKEVEVGGSRH